jgi:catechol 2,3-dioxygenase-like lactoylglutathione lyase family enzyme
VIVGRVHHISFRVRDLERSRRFYGDLLGLEEIPRPDFGVPGIWYDAGGTQVHLIRAPEGMHPPAHDDGISPLANHSAFAIADYVATREQLRARGVAVLETSATQGQMWIRDPDGNVIELIAAPA